MPIIRMSATDHAWAAGFFDGEGSIQISRGFLRRQGWGPYYQMRITVSQMVRDPLDKLTRLYGGTVSRPPGRTIYLWNCSTRPALVALRAMLPYLVVKRAQAEVAIAFQERRKAGGPAKASQDLDEIDRARLQKMKRPWLNETASTGSVA